MSLHRVGSHLSHAASASLQGVGLLAVLALFALTTSCRQGGPSRERSGTQPGGTAAPEGAGKAQPAQDPAPLSEDEKKDAAAKIDEADQLRKTRRLDEALAKLNELPMARLPPDLASRALFCMGESHFSRGLEAAKERLPGVTPESCHAESIRCLEDLVERFPKEEKAPRGAYLLGSNHLVLGDMEKALAQYQKTFDTFVGFEDRSQALLRIGVCQAAMGEPTKARATFQRLLREYPQEKADVSKASKYLNDLNVVGRKASPIQADKWLLGAASEGGLKTFEGEVVFIVFFATWCENCSEEVPHLRRLIQTWSAQGVVFVGVANPDDPKSTVPVDVYLQKNNITYVDVALDRMSRSWGPYGVGTLPAGVLVDRTGMIRWRGHTAFFPKPLVVKCLAEK